MKKIIVILFLFLSLTVAYGSEYIPSDDCFSVSLWFKSDNDLYPPGYNGDREILALVDNASNPLTSVRLTRGEIFTDNYYGFGVKTGANYYESFTGSVAPGSHLLVLNYCSSSPYNVIYNNWRLNDFYNLYSALYIDGVALSPFSKAGILPDFVSGNVILSDLVIPGSFTYSPNVLTSEQIQSLFNFGEPGTIKYQVNLLFWEVIKHFRSFF